MDDGLGKDENNGRMKRPSTYHDPRSCAGIFCSTPQYMERMNIEHPSEERAADKGFEPGVDCAGCCYFGSFEKNVAEKGLAESGESRCWREMRRGQWSPSEVGSERGLEAVVTGCHRDGLIS